MVKFSLVFIFCLFLLTDQLAKPFIGHHDWNGVFYSGIARNYLRSGLVATKLGQMTGPNVFYTHYPPLFPLVLASAFKIFGQSDLVARLVPVFFTAGSLGLLYLISRSWIVIVLALTPMLRYFGQMPSQEALLVFFSCLSVYAYLNHKTKLFYFSVIANALSGWAGYFLYPLLLFKDRSRLLKTGLILVAVFGLHLVHIYILTGSFSGGGILDALLLRLGLFPALGKAEPELAGQFTWISYLLKEARILTVYYTLTLLLLAAAGLLSVRKKLTIILFIWGLSYPLIFSNVVFVHEYFNIFFVPFLALSTTDLIHRFNLRPIFIAIIFLTIFLERNKFYQALKATEAFKPGYQLGLEINRQIPVGGTYTVINSADFIGSQSLFIDFYSDRHIKYLIKDEK